MKKVALSACLLGCNCRYDASHNLNEKLLELLSPYEILSFCPEDHAFGSPRPTMDLIDNEITVLAFSNENANNLSEPIFEYAKSFFNNHLDIDLLIGKDRSPSCGVNSAKVYNKNKELLHRNGTGLMVQVALDFGIECWDAEEYLTNYTS
jgi:uncharacterized protein YbbK (DUF523 family)